MKGFYIEIINNLLEPKHRKAMKESVWLFMWLLDKMTSISEEGVGKVLGGKPIKYKEINDDLKLPERTYYRWIKQLKESKYINTIQAPQGLIITVNKAKKRFGQKPTRTAKNGIIHPYEEIVSDLPKSVERPAKKVGSIYRQDKDKTNNMSAKADNDDFSFQDRLESMGTNSRRHVQIIALYWEFKKLVVENEKQYNSLLKRELRPATRLVGFSNEKILEIMEYLENENTFKWSLESVLKYVGENLNKIKPIVK